MSDNALQAPLMTLREKIAGLIERARLGSGEDFSRSSTEWADTILSEISGEKRCETCAHWKFDKPDWEFDELRFGECKAIQMREDLESEAVQAAGVDRWDAEAEAVRKAALRAAKAFCVDGSSYYAAVRTAPDFGCVLHVAAADTSGVSETGPGKPSKSP